VSLAGRESDSNHGNRERVAFKVSDEKREKKWLRERGSEGEISAFPAISKNVAYAPYMPCR
jgi:hypothetical protein